MDDRFENFIDSEPAWFSDMELRVLDLEKEISEWRSRTRGLAEPGFGREADERAPGRTAASRGTGGHRHREVLRLVPGPSGVQVTGEKVTLYL